VMTLTGSEQFLCFFRTGRFDPPLFDPRDQHGGMERPQPRLLSLSLKGHRSHCSIRRESILSNHFTLKPALMEQTRNLEMRPSPRGGWNALLSTSLSQKPVRHCRQ